MSDKPADRFRIQMDNLNMIWKYEFFDNGECIERGEVASPQIVAERFEAFKALRPWAGRCMGKGGAR